MTQSKPSPYAIPGIPKNPDPLLFIAALFAPRDPFDIVDIVATRWNISSAPLFDKSRNSQNISEARQVCMVIFIYSLGWSPSDAARFFKRDRTTALHAKKTVAQLFLFEKSFKQKLLNLL
jgi:chromosomal replication initiation ATPase DnaA